MEILNPIPVFSSKDVVLRLCKKNPVQIISLMLDPRLRADRIFAFKSRVAVIADTFLSMNIPEYCYSMFQ
jgi:hypothetical protein